MQKTLTLMHVRLAVLSLVLAANLPSAAQGQQATIAADCASDLLTFCPKVSAGNDRGIACLIAYEDQISPRCRLTAYLASGNLGNRLKELQAMAKTCSSDILQYCSKVPAGGGRIYDCLKKNQATLTNDCRAGVPRFETLLKD
ncbi:MAG: cysteine rich repeat-containing protein [Hyphomicrobium sp.]